MSNFYISGNGSMYGTGNFVSVPKTIPVITFTINSAPYSPGGTYALTPLSPSRGEFTYTSSDTSVVTISGGNYIIKNLGTSNITATQAADYMFLTNSIVQTLTITKGIGNIETIKCVNMTSIPDTANNYWISVALSSDGQYQTALQGGYILTHADNYGYIYSSSNYGIAGSWIPVLNDVARNWVSVVMSKSGQYQYAYSPNEIYYSTNYGIAGSWILLLLSICLGITISDSGQYVNILSIRTGSQFRFLYSPDYGENFYPRAQYIAMSFDVTNDYTQPACSSDGKYVLFNTQLNTYLSTSYGSALYIVDTYAVAKMSCIMSATGKYQYVYNNDFYGSSVNTLRISTNYGSSGSWFYSSIPLNTSSRIYSCLQCSPDGRILYISCSIPAGSSYLYISTNYGASGSFSLVYTYTNSNSSSRGITSIGISSNLNYLLAPVYAPNGSIFSTKGGLVSTITYSPGLSFYVYNASTSTGETTFTSSNTSVATITGNFVNLLSIGNTVIDAIQTADSSYNASDVSFNLQVV